MKNLEEIIEKLPENIRLPIYEAFKVFQKDIIHKDLSEIKGDIKKIWETIDKVWKTIDKLTESQKELAEAQRRTEEEIKRVWKAIDELAEAQKRTEERISRLEKVVEELAEAQKRTEERVSRLEKSVNELTEAHKKAEQRISRLEKAVEELANAQKRTEEAVRNLAVQVGRLSDTIGYGLEDVAFVMLPPYLEKHFNIKINDPEKRFFVIDGEEIEVNLYSEGKKNGEKIVLIGECKSRIYGDAVEKFLKKCKILEKSLKDKKIIKVMFGYLIHPSAEKIAKKENVILVASYMR